MKASYGTPFRVFSGYPNLIEGAIQVRIGRKTEPPSAVSFAEFNKMDAENVLRLRDYPFIKILGPRTSEKPKSKEHEADVSALDTVMQCDNAIRFCSRLKPKGLFMDKL